MYSIVNIITKEIDYWIDNGGTKTFLVVCRIDTPNELAYYRHGGIL